MPFDPLSPEFQRDPYPMYDELRQHSPILYWEAWDTWFLTRYEDVSALLRDKRLGRTIDHILSREARGIPPVPEHLIPFQRLSTYSMFDMEPPDHTRIRSLVHKAFTPKRVENLRGRIQEITDELLDKVQEQGRMDILADFATPLPVIVIAELLGIPEIDRHNLRPWSQSIVAMYELDHTPAQEQQAIQAAIEFWDYLKKLAALRRREPQDDLISALALVEEAGEQLKEEELIATCILLLNAGHEATVNVMGNGMLALLCRPEQLRLLIESPALVKTAVEEMMRFDTPLQLFKRWVLEDINYKGYQFKQGTQLALMFGAANRDPARFTNADQLDITREDNPHMSFGNGIHYCLGAPLARMELQIALSTLLRRMPDLQLETMPEYRDTYVIRGLKELNVRFSPA